MSKPKLDFIGTGVMGRPMVTHFANAGYHITIHDVNKTRMEQVVSDQPALIAATTPLDVAKASDIVFTMLPYGEYVQEVALGEYGLEKGLKSRNA